MVSNGATAGVLLNIEPPGGPLPPGDHVVLQLTIEASIPESDTCGSCTLQFSEALGEPPVAILVLYASGQPAPLLLSGLTTELCQGDDGCGDCPTDVDGNGSTDAFDLANLLGAWGTCNPGDPCECLDADGDGSINAFDLAQLLGNWGPCP